MAMPENLQKRFSFLKAISKMYLFVAGDDGKLARIGNMARA